MASTTATTVLPEPIPTTLCEARSERSTADHPAAVLADSIEHAGTELDRWRWRELELIG